MSNWFLFFLYRDALVIEPCDGFETVFKACCHIPFTHAFSALPWVLEVLTFIHVYGNQRNYYENACVSRLWQLGFIHNSALRRSRPHIITRTVLGLSEGPECKNLNNGYLNIYIPKGNLKKLCGFIDFIWNDPGYCRGSWYYRILQNMLWRCSFKAL